MNFSVLLSIYHKEKADYFNRAMLSIWDEQVMKPNEIVLVQDGPLTTELEAIINSWKQKLKDVLIVVPLSKNVGLGDALNAGLKVCSNELIARMDTDDIAAADRFEKQLKIFEQNSVDICSSWISEFDKDESEILSVRKVPEHHTEIIKFAKTRNAINHPAVMYKKSAVEKAGGYKKMMWFEDYYLWARMIMNGAKFYNIQESLVHMRAGYGQLERRGGFKYALEEVAFQKELLSIGFINKKQFIKNNAIRITARILPKSFLKSIYKIIRTK